MVINGNSHLEVVLGWAIDRWVDTTLV